MSAEPKIKPSVNVEKEDEKQNFKILLSSLDKEYDKIILENQELKKKIVNYQKLITQYEQQLGISNKETKENRAEKFIKQVVDFTKKVNINTKLGGIQLENNFIGHTDIITSVQFLPSYTKDSYVSSTSTDGNCYIWNSEKKTPIISYTGHVGSVNKTSFHPTQSLACSFSGDGSVHLWKFDLSAIEQEANSNDGTNNDIDTQDLITESEFRTDGNEPEIEDNETPVPLRLNFPLGKPTPIPSPGSRKNSEFNIQNAELNEEDMDIRKKSFVIENSIKKVNLDSVVISGEWLSDGNAFVTASWDKLGRLFTFNGSDIVQLHTFKGHEASLNGISSGNQNSLLVTCSEDCTARIWDIRTAEQVHVLKAHNISTTNALFNASDRVIITGGDDGLVKFWDMKNLKNPLKTCNIHYAINSIAISNYHSRICIGSTKRHAQVKNANFSKFRFMI
jgi:WD40 repeat protein